MRYIRLLERFKEAYKSFALILVNVAAFLLILNAALYFYFHIMDRFFAQPSDPISKKYGHELVSRVVYPDLTEQTISELLRETWSRPYEYEPFTIFAERPYTGKFVNVDKNGFRHSKNQAPWPPSSDSFNIFVFGGSTVFGYGVSDEQTIASYLQDALSPVPDKNVRVYNFGRGDYYSQQERILFENLLESHFIPDMAIFVDGLNDFYYDSEPEFTKRLSRFFSGESKTPKQGKLMALVNDLPMGRLARALQRRLEKAEVAVKTNNQDKVVQEVRSSPERVIQRYLHNVALIKSTAVLYNVQPIFVWQPIPFYKFDVSYHPFLEQDDADRHRYAGYGYKYMAKYVKENPLGENFFWSADLQEKLKEPLYVDIVHYSAKMSKILAFDIANNIIERNLLEP